ncbi:hypothetical protein EVAR_78354_1 [Eumeta japonica]|uniref:Uncharacterized protein n=1 Tax=Eumeta variegata TaxID=151549 RepID=A0A4C1T5Y7_EUMVA|nr:hypothetical protein EVAR_78354_1 [Eumeta japonica]
MIPAIDSRMRADNRCIRTAHRRRLPPAPCNIHENPALTICFADLPIDSSSVLRSNETESKSKLSILNYIIILDNATISKSKRTWLADEPTSERDEAAPARTLRNLFPRLEGTTPNLAQTAVQTSAPAPSPLKHIPY